MTTCKSCNAPVRWVLLRPKTGKAKAHPVDATPSASGSIRIPETGDAYVVAEADRPLVKFPLYTSHFATCPDAAQHRRPRA